MAQTLAHAFSPMAMAFCETANPSQRTDRPGLTPGFLSPRWAGTQYNFCDKAKIGKVQICRFFESSRMTVQRIETI